jgi:hypothetical protein
MLPKSVLLSLLTMLWGCRGASITPTDSVPDDTGSTETDSGASLVDDCDGEDNDGDGAVDEDWPDTDGDGVADCLQCSVKGVSMQDHA